MRAGVFRFLVVVSCLAAASLAPVIVWAQMEGPTSPAKYEAPAGYRPKEFTIVRKDGVFHIFYLRENLISGVPTQLSFGHATSLDLYQWTEQDTILPVVPGTFEETSVWAPSLHKVGDVYYLFYPGMRDDPANGYHIVQTITCATSTDLYNWTRRETPLFGNELFPWAYVDSTDNLGHECRDPFLWRDEVSGEWLLYVATRPAFQPQSMVIGIAGSTDLETWSDRGYVDITLPASSFSDVAESPHVFTRDDTTLYLLWTTNAGQQLTYGTSTNALTGWGNSRRLRSMLGYSTLGWWGSEVFEADGRTYFGSVHTSWIDFWDMEWTAPDSFDVFPPDSLQLLGAHFDRDSAVVGDTVAIVVCSVNGNGREFALEYTSPDSSDALIDPTPFGLPVSIVLAPAESTVVPFVPQLPAKLPTFRVVVRAPGSPPGEPRLLVVTAPPPPVNPDPIPGDEPPLPEPLPFVLRLFVHRPGEVHFVCETGTEPFQLEVFDVRGRRVWSTAVAAGTRQVVWRPSEDGAAIGPGIYFARMSTPDARRAATVKVPVVIAR